MITVWNDSMSNLNDFDRIWIQDNTSGSVQDERQETKEMSDNTTSIHMNQIMLELSSSSMTQDDKNTKQVLMWLNQDDDDWINDLIHETAIQIKWTWLTLIWVIDLSDDLTSWQYLFLDKCAT